MAVSLQIRDSQARSLRLNIVYDFDTFVDGRRVTPEIWSVYTGGVQVFSGAGSDVRFAPTLAQTYTIHIAATHPEGYPVEGVFSYTVTTRASNAATLTVKWEKPAYNTGDNLVGEVSWSDPDGLPAKISGWTLRWNNRIVLTGSDSLICYRSCLPGLWRAEIRGTDFYGVPLQGDATVVVQSAFERRDTAPVQTLSGTLIYLGSVFSNEVANEGGTATTLPYQLSTSSQSNKLLPGTTHVLFSIDQESDTVDDEVIVRTHTGNYALLNAVPGLSVGYDYAPVDYLPAPVDLSLRYTVDTLNTSGYTYGESRYRIQVRCYRLSSALYRYTPCPFSMLPGGEGKRNRRWGLVFTGIEAEKDGQRVVYTTQEPTSIPLTTLTSSGLPDPYDAKTKSFFTEANRFAIYEGVDTQDLDAKAVCAVEGLRPFCMAIQQPSSQPDFKTVVRLNGHMTVYANGSALNAGSVITVRIQTSLGEHAYTLPVTEDVYNATDDVLVRVGSIDIDLTDYQFDFNGVVAWVSMDETAIVPIPPGTLPTPYPGPSYVYAGTFNGTVAPAVAFDGASYGSPVLMDEIEVESATLATPISGCNDPAYGPVAVYCYAKICAPFDSVCVTQPLHNPAPYVAYGTAPMAAYATPKFIVEGSTTGNFITVDGTLCGEGYAYDRCDSKGSVVIVYPCTSAPHSFVHYADNCYQLTGPVTTFGTAGGVPVTSVTPVSSCMDYVCTRANINGDSYVYFDAQTDDKVFVYFGNLDRGVPALGVAPSKIDLSVNLSEGAASLVFSTSPRLEILRSTGTGVLLMKVGLAATSKRILVANSSGMQTHTLPVHVTSASVAVDAGDIVYLDISVAGNYTKMMRGTRTKVTWAPYVALPRVYDVAYGSVPGTYAVAALGFTGAVDRTPYEFYGMLPADVQSTNVNPDSLVTVQGVDVPTPEYALIRCRAVGEYPPVMPAIGWYAGRTFTGRVKFNFYALRKRQASHGEMDVWFSTDSAFPEYLLAQPYRALKRDARSYRADHLSTDAKRSVYQASTSLDGAALPNVYVAPSDGQVISSKADTAQIVRESKVFNKLRVDAGISQNVVD